MLLACVLLPGEMGAQQNLPANGLFLIAKPTLLDPNFARTVVLVTQTPDASTVGVIINRPSALKLSALLPQDFATQNYRDAVYFGGPVMGRTVLALYRSETVPEAAAFHVLKNIYLTMHGANLKLLLDTPEAKYRLFAGFSGWAPRQLESEFVRDGWYILPADEALLFRQSADGLWEELVERAARRAPRTHNSGSTIPTQWSAPCDC